MGVGFPLGKRHPELALCISEPLANVSVQCATSDVIDKYFNILPMSNELMDKPCQIFNCNESGMRLTPHPPKAKRSEASNSH